MLKTTARLGAPFAFALGAADAFAADKPVIDTGDTAWLLIATALVLMMNIPGLALFYAGMVRKKNVLATAVQAFAVAALVTVLWFAFGYSLAYTDGGALNGAIYGALAEVSPAVRAGAGSLFGVALFAVADEAVVPMLVGCPGDIVSASRSRLKTPASRPRLL